VSAILVLCVGPATAQNLLTNGTFDGSLTGWAASSNTTYDSTLDNTGASGSGPAQSVVTANDLAVVTQCIAIRPGAQYTFGGDVILSATLNYGGAADFGVKWYSGVNCGGSQVGSASYTSGATTRGAWLSLSSSLQTAPTGAVSVLLLAEHTVPATGTDQANFDNMFLDGPAATTIPVLGRVGFLALATVCAALGIWLLRRRVS